VRIGVFAFKRFCKILIQIIEINIFQTSLSQQFERLVVFLKSRKNGFYRFYMVAFTSRIKTLSENKLFRIVFKVVKYNVLFAFEITVKRSLYLVEGDTLAISYNMYLTAKADMGPLKAGTTYKIKVTEFNKFANLEGYDEPMIVHLLLTSTTPGV